LKKEIESLDFEEDLVFSKDKPAINEGLFSSFQLFFELKQLIYRHIKKKKKNWPSVFWSLCYFTKQKNNFYALLNSKKLRHVFRRFHLFRWFFLN